MKPLATTRMSSKGQVVIPESIRESLGLTAGTQFIVVAEDDVVVLKMITPPSPSAFDAVISRARKQAREAGLTPAKAAETTARYRKTR